MAAAAASSSSSSLVVFLITGASRGLGKAIATVAGKAYGKPNGPMPRFLLVARSFDGMKETKNDILLNGSTSSTSSSTSSTTTSACSSTISSDHVLCRTMDLSDLDRLDSNADCLFDDMNRLCLEGNKKNQQLVFVNNAANLGHLGPSRKSPSLHDMRQTIDFNITASLWLSVRFARYFHQLEKQQSQQQQQLKATIVNISSLVAVSKDFSGLGIYSAGKAAREMYHSLMARDEETSKGLKILNYAPGPLQTSMTEDIQFSKGLDKTDLQASFRETQMLDPRDSAKKLIRLIETNEFESGSHIDYFDLPDREN